MKFLICLLAAFVTLSADSRAQIPLEHFARLPAASDVTLSPGGDQIAYFAADGDSQTLVVTTIEGSERSRAVLAELRAEGIIWVDEDLLLIRVGWVQDDALIRGTVDFSRLYAVDLNTMEITPLIRTPSRYRMNNDRSTIVGWVEENGRFILPLYDENGRNSLHAVDPRTNRFRKIENGSQYTTRWITNDAGNRFAETRLDPERGEFEILVRDEAGIRTVLSASDANVAPYSLVAFADDDQSLILTTRDGPNATRALVKMPIASGGNLETIFLNQREDLRAIRRDPYTNELVGYTDGVSTPDRIWLDPTLSDVQDGLEAALPGYEVNLTSWDEARTRFVAVVDGPALPPRYVLFDRETSAAAVIGDTYPDLVDGGLLPREAVSFTARDGTHIPGFIIRPEGDGPHPYVVLPHGGPEAVDLPGFDYFAHFISSRGIGVIQPNFRGSSGYGQHYAEQGYGQWGLGVMQHDLSDAAMHLVSNENADPDRICIVGASYGGYAALAGASFTPDLYACAVAFAPVTDADEMLDYEIARYGRDSRSVLYWTRVLGGRDDGTIDWPLLRAVSPARHAESIRAPVLLLHGEDDSVVPIAQSRMMRRAIERAGGEVRLVEMEGGDHWLTGHETRVTLLSELERFLAEHLAE